MSVTVDALAAALREAMPECNVFVNDQTLHIRFKDYRRNERIAVFVSVSRGQPRIDASTLKGRYGRDLARAVFDCIDRLEDRDGK